MGYGAGAGVTFVRTGAGLGVKNLTPIISDSDMVVCCHNYYLYSV